MGDIKTNFPEIDFHKFSGAGNDFIVVDNRDGRYSDFLSNEKNIVNICKRHFGIDADGIIEVKLHKEHGLEFVCRARLGHTYNMCGNGSRIFVSFAKMYGIHTGSDDVTFLAGDGVHHGNYDPVAREAWVSIRDIPAQSVTKLSENDYVVNTGLYHLVVFVDYDVRTIEDAYQHGYHLTEKYKQYNCGKTFLIVNFVFEKDGILHSRCCNRNICDEIVACGTATGAIGVAHAIKSGCPVPGDFESQIQWPGGLMKCLLHRDETTFNNMKISGPIRQVFKGTFYTDSTE